MTLEASEENILCILLVIQVVTVETLVAADFLCHVHLAHWSQYEGSRTVLSLKSL